MRHKINKPSAPNTDTEQTPAKAAQQDTFHVNADVRGEGATPLKSDGTAVAAAPNGATPTDEPASMDTDTKSPVPGSSTVNEPKVTNSSTIDATGSTPASQAAEVADDRVPQEIPDKPVSPQKQASNANNAQFSTGPRTAAGKKKSSMNALKSGTYARHLFATAAQWASDGQDYRIRAAAIRDTYRPKNAMVELWVEKLAADMTHLARILRHEQAVLALDYPFENPRIERIIRAKTAAERAVYRDIAELERFQQEGNLTWEQPESFELDPGIDGGKAGAPSSESTVDSGGPVHGAVEADGKSTLPDASENHPGSGAEVWQESETVIYQRPPELPDLPQTTVPVFKPSEPRESSGNLERIRTILENWRFNG